MGALKTREQIYSEILQRLSEWMAIQGPRACIGITLVYPEFNAADTELVSWRRDSEHNPEQGQYFETPALWEKMARKILDTAEIHCDSFPTGVKPRRYRIRADLAIGSREAHQFMVQPTVANSGAGYELDDGEDNDEQGGGRRDRIGRAFEVATKINAQMYTTTIGINAQQTMQHVKMINDLMAENRELRVKLEEAQINRMNREWEITKEMKAADRQDVGFAKVMQLLSFGATKLLGAGAGDVIKAGDPTPPVVLLLAQFFDSLEPPQQAAFQQILKPMQLANLMEIYKIVEAYAKAAQEAQQAQQANGAATGAPQQGNNGARPTTPNGTPGAQP